MISDEKMIHIVHLMLEGTEKAKLVTYPKGRDEAIREAKKVCLLFLGHMNAVADLARQRISTQKNPPMEGSSQWETLYQKYYEEELRKRGA